MFLRKFFAVAGLATLALGVPATAAFASPASPGSHSSWQFCPPSGHNYLGERDILPWRCFPPRPHCVTQTVSMWYDLHGQLVTDAMVTAGEHLKLDGTTYTVTSDLNGHGGLYDVTVSPSIPWWLRGGILDFKSSFPPFCVR